MTDLLILTQWLSPSFPTGAFAYSHGLEVAMQSGEVKNALDVQEWTADILALGTGRVDACLLVHAYRGADPTNLGAFAKALASSKERWEETEAQGRAFATTLNATSDAQIPLVALPVAIGFAARRLDLPTEVITSLYLHSFASNLVSAAVRFIPLGQSEGQQVLSALHPVISEISASVLDTELCDISSFVPRADIHAMEHETLAVRIFKT